MNQKPLIVGLTGRLHSGKTVLAKHLESNGYKRRSFASIIKEVLSIIGFPHWSLYGSAEDKARIVPEFGVSGRYACQTLGTEWGRDMISPDIWTRSLFINRPKDEYTVIDDLRFPNELLAIHERGGVAIGIRRSAAQQVAESHQSELLVDGLEVDAWLENESTLEDLQLNLEQTLNTVWEIRKAA